MGGRQDMGNDAREDRVDGTVAKGYAPIGRPVPHDRPVLLLDFDGVINVFRKPDFDPLAAKPSPITDAYDIDRRQSVSIDTRTDPWAFDTYPAGGIERKYRIRYASKLIADILDAEDAGLLTVVWLTSWKKFAPLRLEPMLGMRLPGMRGHAYADWLYRGLSDDGSYGKASWVGDAYDTGALAVPFVSVDDSYTVGELLRARTDGGSYRVAPSVPRLAITTDERVGITQGEWKHIVGFCKENMPLR